MDTHLRDSSSAMSTINSRSSKGSWPSGKPLAFVKTLDPIWNEILDESPWSAFETPMPAELSSTGASREC